MAELVVGAIVTVLIEKLAGELMSFARSQGIDSQLQELKTTLPLIQAVLADAAQKQITQKPVELWLVELQDLVYDIEDVLDDIATEAMKRNLQGSIKGSTSSSGKVLKMIPITCCTPHNIMYSRKMSSNLDKITTRLTNLFKQRQSLGLNVIGETTARTNKRLEETSLLPDVSEILGREGDKETLLGKMLWNEGASTNQNVSIMSIVGMGGIGKTTLARLLYNDQKVKDHFKLRAWICVSDDFDVFNISKKIYQAVGGYNQDFATLDLLHVALKEKLSKEMFLIVLDDVWNEDHNKWEDLKKPLVGAPGSKVIVTTRNTMVASVMNSIQPYDLRVLKEEIALSLFARYALEENNFDKYPSLSTIARGIVKKCGGLPLALVTIGRVLKTKGNDEVEWELLLNSEIWSSEDGSGILPALKLSYYHLPSHLKQLFAYCSLYPKGHQFDKSKLVLKWMAQGFLSHTTGDKSMENLGHAYFEELRLRCFFQPSAIDKSQHTMHDLMNDMAVSVAGKFFFMFDNKVDTNGRNEDFEKFRHFSFMVQQYPKYGKFKELHRASCLRTFLAVGGAGYFNKMDNVFVKLLTRLEFLRVLSLTNESITLVPQSIGNLKHLRYLNFSSTNIKHLPKQVGKLYNLQSLLVRDCIDLSSLPVSFANLINLRHLDMTNTPSLKKLPLGIGGMRNLQNLSKIIIEGGNGFKISELKGLSNLQGALSIRGLHEVTDPTEANDANLRQKKGLDDLDMEWSDAFDVSRNPTIEYNVVEKLRPPSKLQKLSISFYGGMKFPSWLANPTSFDRLSELMLRGCENCTDLPMLGHLSSLQKLCLSSLKAMQTAELLAPTKSFHGNAFMSLESLEVDDMQCLEIRSSNGGDDVETPQSFPSLRAISIKRCPKLGKVSFGLIPSLEELTIEECPEGVFRDLVGVSSSIRTLKLYGIKGLTQLDREVLKHLGALEVLSIEHCYELRNLWETDLEACRFLRSSLKLDTITGKKEVVNVGSSIMGYLRQVTLDNCHSLESYCCPASVEWLLIWNCSSMTSLSFSESKKADLLPSASSSSSSSNLKTLVINGCKNLTSIGENGVVNVGSSIIMGSLREVRLVGCHSLESYCCPNSVEWLEIEKCSSMTSLSFSNLKFLRIYRCKNIKSISQEHLQSLTSLEEMWILDCPSIEDSFPSCELLWPPNLRKLAIGELKRPMSEWGFQNYPTSLVELFLYGKNSGVVSFGIMEEQHSNNTISPSCFLLPPSLTELRIWDFEEVESVSEVLQHLPHLQQLHIVRCPQLRDALETTSSLTVSVI